MKELYFSTDIETDGPIPGPNSMLSFGVVALTADLPGWEGTEFGWGYVSEADVNWNNCPDEDISPPEREEKPITSDQWLFTERDKLDAYLGKDDPLLKEE